MRSLVEQKENTNYAILTLLYNNSQGTTLVEISEKLGLGVKTARVYIGELVDYLDRWFPNIRVRYENKRYSIECKKNFNIEIVYSSMKKETSFFDLYHYHFMGKFTGVRNFATEYYCSSSRVYTQLKKMRELLKPYEIDFGSSIENYDFIGDEQMIRFHTFHYYWEIYKGIEWPFDAELESKCYVMIYGLAKCMGIELSIVEKQQLALWLGIINTRIGLEKFVELDEDTMNSVMQSDFGKRHFAIIYYSFEEKLHKKSSESAFFLLVFMLTCKRLLNKKDMEPLENSDLIDFCSKVQGEIFANMLSVSEINQYNSLLLEGIYYSNYLNVDLLMREKTQSALLPVVIQKFTEAMAGYEMSIRPSSDIAVYFGNLFFDVIDIKKLLVPVKIKFLLSNGLIDEYPIRKKLLYLFPNLIFATPIDQDCTIIITDSVNSKETEDDYLYFNGRNQLEWEELKRTILAYSIPKENAQKLELL